jgi:vesicle coat complex subunit
LRISGPRIPEVRKLAMQALTTEQDPEILSNAIGALHPGIAAQSESAAVLRQLEVFAGHIDPEVRAQSIRGLAAWDKTGEAIPFVRRALLDAAPQVRSAAVVSIIENHLRSDELKRMLMHIAHSTEESAGLRTNAVVALERFSLSSDEYTRVLQSAMQADALLDAQFDVGQ